MTTATDRPNILIIMSDQHSAGMCGCYGNAIVRTPNIDRLAREGTRFDAAYTPSPVCVPARMAFMTGRRPSDIRVMENYDILASGIPTWAHHLSLAGYETALIGRMHFEGPDQNHGFEVVDSELVNWRDGHPVWHQVTSEAVPNHCYWAERPSLMHSGHGTTGVQWRDELAIEKACEYLRRKAAGGGRPFAAVAGFYMPHSPYIGRKDLFEYYRDKVQIPAETEEQLPPYLKRFYDDFRTWFDPPIPEERKRIVIAAYHALCEHSDELVGKVLDTLEKTGLAENTVVVYCSDHGDMAGHMGLWGKIVYYEDSARVPLVIRHPAAGVPGTVCPRVCNLRDLAATLCAIAGADPLTRTDARSFLPLLTHPDAPWDDYTESELCNAPIVRQKHPCTSRMIRQGPWKFWGYCIDGKHDHSLFNLAEDPCECHDLVNDERSRAIAEKLKKRLYEDWQPERLEREAMQRMADRRLFNKAMKPLTAGPPYSLPAHVETGVEIFAEST
ncbi:MAG: sulfatase-like hydrolase/transferase [Kiritimatiellae bacterium]|nr:sulfatase-like hydrolase/transferase [Kiritimatiellia bacterium]